MALGITMASNAEEVNYGPARFGAGDTSDESSDFESNRMDDPLGNALVQQLSDPLKGGRGGKRNKQLTKLLNKLNVNAENDDRPASIPKRTINCNSCSKWTALTYLSKRSSAKCPFCKSLDIFVSRVTKKETQKYQSQKYKQKHDQKYDQKHDQNYDSTNNVFFSIQVYDSSSLVATNLLLRATECKTLDRFKRTLRRTLSEEYPDKQNQISSSAIRQILPSVVFGNVEESRKVKSRNDSFEFHEWFHAAIPYSIRQQRPAPLVAEIHGDHQYLRNSTYGVKGAREEELRSEAPDLGGNEISRRRRYFSRRDDRSRSPPRGHTRS